MKDESIRANGWNEYRYILLIVLVSLAFRILYTFACTDYPHYLYCDMGGYWERAIERFNGRIFGAFQWGVWPPFYHFLLADLFKLLDILGLFKYKLEIVLVLNCLLSAVSVFFLYLIALKTTTHKWTSLLISGTYAVSYPLLYLNAFVMSENLAVPSTIIALWCLFRATPLSLACSGLFLGVSVATRPSYVPLIVIFVPHILLTPKITRQSIGRTLLFSCLFFVVIFSTVIENYHISRGKLKGLSASGGIIFYLAHSLKYKAICTSQDSEFWISPPSNFLHPERDTVRFQRPIYDDAYYYKLGWGEVARNPGIWLTKLIKMKELFFGYFWPFDYNAKGYHRLMSLSQNMYFFMFSFCALTFVCFKTNLFNNRFLLTIVLIPLSLISLLYFYNVEQRYMYSFAFAIHLVFFSAVYAIVAQYHLLKRYLYMFMTCFFVVMMSGFCRAAVNRMTMDRIIDVTVYKDMNPIRRIDQKRNTVATTSFFVDRLNFPLKLPFTHDTLGETQLWFNFFAVFDTSFEVLKEGRYEWQVYCDDAVDVQIDGKTALKIPVYENADKKSIAVYLGKGKHHLKVSFFQGAGPCGLIGFYKQENAPDGQRTMIGQSSGCIRFLVRG